jgi:hypothetical protein
MRDPSRIKLEEYGWEMTEETQRGGEYYILNRHDRRALDSYTVVANDPQGKPTGT